MADGKVNDKNKQPKDSLACVTLATFAWGSNLLPYLAMAWGSKVIAHFSDSGIMGNGFTLKRRLEGKSMPRRSGVDISNTTSGITNIATGIPRSTLKRRLEPSAGRAADGKRRLGSSARRGAELSHHSTNNVMRQNVLPK